MTLTFRQLPPALGDALRKKASLEGKSVEDAALDAMARGLGVQPETSSFNNLGKFVGSWVEDPEFDEALKDFERIDPELWK